MQRQDSPKFPPEPNPYSTSLFIPTLFFPSWGPGSALARGAIEPPSCFPGLLEKSWWMLTGAMGGGGDDFESGLRALDSAPLREKGVDEGENDTNR